VTTGPGCDGVLTESDAHEVPCPHSETSRAARVSVTMRRIAPRRLSRLMNSGCSQDKPNTRHGRFLKLGAGSGEFRMRRPGRCPGGR
jgi:hypothetical protein